MDVVIRNGVINLCPDKGAVYRELYRVLKPGGRHGPRGHGWPGGWGGPKVQPESY